MPTEPRSGAPLSTGPRRSGASAGRPRVLLLAYTCSPDRGSEASVGWNRAIETAREFDTWVICERGRSEAAVSRYLATHGPIPGLTFSFVPGHGALESLRRLPGLYLIAYNLWHRRALRVARRLHATWRFDLVHQVTFCGYREPGYTWMLGAPFVWGPVGGTQNYPWRFLRVAGLRGAIVESLRTVTNELQLRFSPRVRRAARAARVLLAANSTTVADFERVHGLRPRLLLETGLPAHLARPGFRHRGTGPLRILWSGELKPHKALPLLLDALRDLPSDVEYELRVLGSGWESRRWRRLARRAGIASRVSWLGWLPHADALRQYAWADLFVFTSLRDTSGNVVLEALGAGVPVVCLDHQGARDIVTERCGVRVPVTTPADVVRGLHEAIAWLGRDLDSWHRLSRGAVERAQDFLWSAQTRRMSAVYRDALAGDRPARWPRTLPRHRELARNAGKRVAGRLGIALAGALGSRSRGQAGVLVYHRVAPAVAGLPVPTINVPPERFREQVTALVEQGFSVWPLRRLIDCHRRDVPVPARTVVITFDDGYESVYRYAWPVLRELRLPATIFLATAYLDTESAFPFDDWGRTHGGVAPAETFRPVTVAQCREMAASGLIELGAHTHTHRDLRGLPDEFLADLRTSVDVVRSAFGTRDVTFAFPFGRRHLGFAGHRLVAAARQTGVLCGLTTDATLVDPQSDPFQWGRFNVYDWDTGATLAAKLQGWYSWAPALQEWAWRKRHAVTGDLTCS